MSAAGNILHLIKPVSETLWRQKVTVSENIALFLSSQNFVEKIVRILLAQDYITSSSLLLLLCGRLLLFSLLSTCMGPQLSSKWGQE